MTFFRPLALLCCLAISHAHAGDEWSMLGDDKYAIHYVTSPIFKKVGANPSSANDEVIIRVSRISSWGVQVVEAFSTAGQVRIDKYACGPGQDVEGGKIYHLPEHRVKLITDSALAAAARRQLTDPALLDFLRKTAELKVNPESDLTDGANTLVEVLSGGKTELIYLRGAQLGAGAKEMPAILLSGILGFGGD